MNSLRKSDVLLGPPNRFGSRETWYVEFLYDNNRSAHLRNDVGKELWRQVSHSGTFEELARQGFTLLYSRFDQTPAQVCRLCGEAYDCYC
jgi:hypothetical protein